MDHPTPPSAMGVTAGQEPEFLKGVAISVWQNSGDEHSNWTRFVRNKWPFQKFGVRTFKGPYGPDQASPDFWGRYEEDIVCAHKLGCTSFRLSIEWARIEPQNGQIDDAAVKRYHEILDVLDKYHMQPMATLHHFVHPAWFSDLGGFTKEGNVNLFVRWARTAVQLFGHRIKLWGTFNEPTVAMFCGYLQGVHAPGNMLNFAAAGHVLLNKLKAHTQAYYAIKALPDVGSRVEVGLVHHHLTFTTHGTGVMLPVVKWIARWLQFWWGYDVIHRWMVTGKFEWHVPGLGSWINYDFHAKPPCDWWGINYYTRAVLSTSMQMTTLPGEVLTDMFYPIHAEGLYLSIKQSSQYGVPIYITETGIADRVDKHRALWIDSYMRQVLRAIKEGCDVRGFYYWTLCDNFEWAEGYHMKFGLYGWEPNGSKDRVLKEGSRTLVKYYKTLPDDLASVRKAIANMNFEEEGEVEKSMKEAGMEVQDEDKVAFLN